MSKRIGKQTAIIELNLEESGVICHLLLAAILSEQFFPGMDRRMESLYHRITSVNDNLMNHETTNE